jgi:lysozyme family protein
MAMILPAVEPRAAETADPLTVLANSVISTTKPMTKFDEIYQNTIVKEGGSKFTHFTGKQGSLEDPPTRWGITQDTLSEWLGRRATIDEVRNLPGPTAKEIYRNLFYKKYGIDKLPEDMQEHIHDLFVNHSPNGVSKIMQTVLKKNGVKVKFDGKYGPETRQAYEKLAKSNWEKVNDDTVDARRAYYEKLAESPKKEGFYWGWIDRAESFRLLPLPADHDWAKSGPVDISKVRPKPHPGRK